MNDRLYELGAELYGLDATARDFVGFSLFQNFYSQSTRMTVAYENSHYYPDFFLAPSVKAGGTCGGICNAKFSAGLLIPFLKFYRRQYLYLRGHYDYDREFALQDARGFIGYSFSNTQLFARSVSPENGRRVGVAASINHRYYDQEPRYGRTFVESFAEYAEYLPGFFRNNVFLLRGIWAHSWNVGDGFLLWQPYTYYDDYDFLRIRGYRQGFKGQGLFLGTLEYRFPLYQPDWGFFRVPFFFRDFYGKFFFDVAQAYYLAPRPSPSIQRSAGAELGLANIFGYQYMWSAYLGYARGFDEQGEHQVYFGIVGYTGVLWAKYSPHSEFH